MSYVHVPPLDKYKQSDCLVPLCYTQGDNEACSAQESPASGVL